MAGLRSRVCMRGQLLNNLVWRKTTRSLGLSMAVKDALGAQQAFPGHPEDYHNNDFRLL